MSGVDTAETIVNAIVKFRVEILHQNPRFTFSPHNCYIYTSGLLQAKRHGQCFHHDLVYRYWICVTNYHGYAPFVLITIQFFPHSWLITGFATREERQMPLVEKEMPTLDPWFSGILVALSLVFCVVFCTPLFVLLTFDLRLLITTVGIFTLFLQQWKNVWICQKIKQFARCLSRHILKLSGFHAQYCIAACIWWLCAFVMWCDDGVAY